MKKLLVSFCYVLLFAISAVYAAAPAQPGVVSKHPNLARALSFVEMAREKIVVAQRANEYDLGGHAEKAKSLLDQASGELKLAAVAAEGENDGNNLNRPEDTPEPNVSANKHPNIAKAQVYIESAYTSVINAQKANEYDLKGHAAKAKELLEQASAELKLAAAAANDKK